MCPAGNAKSTGEGEAGQLDTTTTTSGSRQGAALAQDNGKEANRIAHRSPGDQGSSGKDHINHHDGSDDDTSDPIVVSPASSPLPSVGDDGGEEIFEDANGEVITPIVPPPPSLVAVGLHRKANPLTLTSWSALALTLDGRDKITKVFQYSARLLAWWFAGTGSKHLSFRFSTLYKSLANSRKAFRLGRSLIEIEKLRNMGLGPLIMWHLRNTMGLHDNTTDVNDSGDKTTQLTKKRPPKILTRRASSNIGWGPMTLDDEEDSIGARKRKPSFVRSLSSKAYRAIYRPLRSTLSTVMGDSSSLESRPAAELWTVIGSAFKMIGLLGFWAGDNINYLYSTGFLDDHTLPTAEERLEKRNKLQTLSSTRANQAYFGGSVAGLLVNAYSYMNYRRNKLMTAQHQWEEACEEGEEEREQALQNLKKVKEKQFSLFLALLKSCCDIIVFSNNPGIDLHQKWRGKKNHEGFHCLCGLVSAGTVLYNNFPDA